MHDQSIHGQNNLLGNDLSFFFDSFHPFCLKLRIEQQILLLGLLDQTKEGTRGRLVSNWDCLTTFLAKRANQKTGIKNLP